MITYLEGDATMPVGDDKKLIVHICNDIGAWGAGFVLAISKRWAMPEKQYRAMAKQKRKLGTYQIIPVENDIQVVNIIGQHNTAPSDEGVPPIRYEAVFVALQKLAQYAMDNNMSIHMPRIGCGLAGGVWDIMEKVIHCAVPDQVPVTVYDYIPQN
jgi:O-acetyl-ADP-ribose deacetylase (regulator of RNase III)